MIVGILKEIKAEENRVSMTPDGAAALVDRGHRVLVERGAGMGSEFDDALYERAGAVIVDKPDEVYRHSEMVLHVKEPLPAEYGMIRPGQVVFTYFHFAASEDLVKAMMASRAVCIAYETLTDRSGGLPLLTPMSEIAGRMAAQEAAKCLERNQGGRGILMGGVPGVAPARVLILGGGTVGAEAARIACGLGATVHLLDTSLPRLRHLAEVLPGNCIPMMSSPTTIRELAHQADVVIGAVLLPGAKAPKLITRELLAGMKRGAVVVDVAIDQGGCCETSRPTTHAQPVYEVDGILHYCVANMPGAVPLTSTLALTNATLPYALTLADKGWQQAAQDDPGIGAGINMVDGRVTCQAVADAFGLPYSPLTDLLRRGGMS
ncbi:alanine dehydrogenase [Desulfobulbus sp.]|uniref:alanine dehydrogenase n=1 Tax=Desulfobulbus sp. TaxID=895 RepID=UPI00286F985B|nr:alanine dehydrogenase [Desulfobulbus sp.]